jgi:hypothetical protein
VQIDWEVECRKIYEQINFTQDYLLSSMTTNKIALKPQNSVIAVSNLTKYLLTPTSDLYYYYIVLHHTTTANVIFTIVFFRVSKEASQGDIEWVFFFTKDLFYTTL